jgi:hypothetical protein
MRITLSPRDSERWLAGTDTERVEESVFEWAAAQQITEPVVVALDTGEVAFVFALEGDV